jgi:hypothetical protein
MKIIIGIKHLKNGRLKLILKRKIFYKERRTSNGNLKERKTMDKSNSINYVTD